MIDQQRTLPLQSFYWSIHLWGGMGIRALAFHFCNPSSIPESAKVICELSLFDVLFLSHNRGFFIGISSFPSSKKKNNMYAKMCVK